ncbi:MAG: hypothetical protein G01um1014106_11 [Parcubacteria group bacterium Gr01-1014_106]|nr:MAG: hypothetical protein G01um1014106_11 [Parcubacteria group bacterium Gr01-1014_106]
MARAYEIETPSLPRECGEEGEAHAETAFTDYEERETWKEREGPEYADRERHEASDEESSVADLHCAVVRNADGRVEDILVAGESMRAALTQENLEYFHSTFLPHLNEHGAAYFPGKDKDGNDMFSVTTLDANGYDGAVSFYHVPRTEQEEEDTVTENEGDEQETEPSASRVFAASVPEYREPPFWFFVEQQMIVAEKVTAGQEEERMDTGDAAQESAPAEQDEDVPVDLTVALRAECATPTAFTQPIPVQKEMSAHVIPHTTEEHNHFVSSPETSIAPQIHHASLPRQGERTNTTMHTETPRTDVHISRSAYASLPAMEHPGVSPVHTDTRQSIENTPLSLGGVEEETPHMMSVRHDAHAEQHYASAADIRVSRPESQSEQVREHPKAEERRTEDTMQQASTHKDTTVQTRHHEIHTLSSVRMDSFGNPLIAEGHAERQTQETAVKDLAVEDRASDTEQLHTPEHDEKKTTRHAQRSHHQQRVPDEAYAGEMEEPHDSARTRELFGEQRGEVSPRKGMTASSPQATNTPTPASTPHRQHMSPAL